jgi:lysophospholipase L1-like esterase
MKKVLIVLVLGLVGWLLLFNLPWIERFVYYFKSIPEGRVWNAELEKQTNLYSKSPSVVFLGDSHIGQCEWGEIFPELKVLNRGIPGESTGLTLKRIDKILPDSSLVFLQIGINDILSGVSENQILKNYMDLIDFMAGRQCHVIPTLIFPTRFIPERNKLVLQVNTRLKTEFEKRNLRFIDLTQSISKNGILNREVSWDGVHLNSTGYTLWINEINKSLKQTAWADDFR